VLVGPVARLPASQYPRLLAIALLLRHSWCPRDLSSTATRLGLSPSTAPAGAARAPASATPRDRGHRRRRGVSTSISERRTRCR
jgi:hypothetical protein